MNALLLALLAGATWQLTLGSAAVAGLLIGIATALKAFPALAILYLAARRYWTAAIAATASAFVLSVVMPAAVYGVAGFSNLAQDVLAAGQQRLADSGQQPVAHRRARSVHAWPLVSQRRSRGRQSWSETHR